MLLREHCIKSAIKEEEFDKVAASKSQVVLNGLLALETNELNNVLKIWRLHENDAWEYIKLTEAFYLEEYRLLEQARKELRKGWRRLYSTFVSETKADKVREADIKHGSSREAAEG